MIEGFVGPAGFSPNGDSWWAPLDRIMAELADPATDWDDALRSAALARGTRLYEADVTERDWIAFRACLNLWDWQKNGGKAA